MLRLQRSFLFLNFFQNISHDLFSRPLLAAFFASNLRQYHDLLFVKFSSIQLFEKYFLFQGVWYDQRDCAFLHISNDLFFLPFWEFSKYFSSCISANRWAEAYFLTNSARWSFWKPMVCCFISLIRHFLYFFLFCTT